MLAPLLHLLQAEENHAIGSYKILMNSECKGKGKKFDLSPKSHAKTASKVQAPKQDATTIGSKKAVKKEDGIISSIQPKKLFTKDSEKSAPPKKPLKSGRMAASRYNQITNVGNSAVKELRKRSLPENEEFKKSDRKRASLAGKFQSAGQWGAERRVDKQLEMSSEVAIQNRLGHKTPFCVSKVLGRVPKVRTLHCTDGSPRDSRPAKRASELAGRKFCFNLDNGEVEESFCDGSNFTEGQVTKECLKIRVLQCNERNLEDSSHDYESVSIGGKDVTV